MLKIFIDGMMCDHCTNHVSAALSDLEGVSKVKEVSLSGKYALIEGAPDEQQIRNAIEDEGYTVTKIEKC